MRFQTTKPFLCRLKLHKWGRWQIHPVYGDRDLRRCIRCGHPQERKDGRIWTGKDGSKWPYH